MVEGTWFLQLKKADGSEMDLAKVTKWLAESTNDHVKSVNPILRCVFCWRGAGTGNKTRHVAEACPWVHTINAQRDKLSLSHIVIWESEIYIGNEKQSATAESVQKRLDNTDKSVEKLREKVVALELLVQQALSSEPQAEAFSTKRQRKEAKKAAKVGEKGRAK